MVQRLAYLAPPGTFGEQAALAYAPDAELIPEPTHAEVVAAVATGRAELAIVAIENSLEGGVSETLDALLASPGVFMRGELVLPVEHHLIAAPEAKLEDITVVTSHPQALAQCRAFLQSRLPGARLEAALSTAAAVARAVAEPGVAAIGTRRAAELSAGAVLQENVQDSSQNKTRFVVLSREDAPPSGDDKTSIAFTTQHDRPGSLLAVLRELSDRGLNMTRIESRPTREELGIYIFLVDFQGHRQEPRVAEALAAIEKQSQHFRLFGSYPRYV